MDQRLQESDVSNVENTGGEIVAGARLEGRHRGVQPRRCPGRRGYATGCRKSAERLTSASTPQKHSRTLQWLWAPGAAWSVPPGNGTKRSARAQLGSEQPGPPRDGAGPG